LPGITPERGYQIMAGAVVLRTAMKVFGVDTLTISPWALREGIVLRYIDALDAVGVDAAQSAVSPTEPLHTAANKRRPVLEHAGSGLVVGSGSVAGSGSA